MGGGGSCTVLWHLGFLLLGWAWVQVVLGQHPRVHVSSRALGSTLPETMQVSVWHTCLMLAAWT